MKNPFASREKEFGYWDLSREQQIEGLTTIDPVVRNSVTEDILCPTSEPINFESMAGWCNSPETDILFTQYGISTSQSTASSLFGLPHLHEQKDFSYTFGNDEDSYSREDTSLVSPFDRTSNWTDIDQTSGKQCRDSSRNNSLSNPSNCLIPAPLSHSLDEKMLKALSLFMESSGEGILAQVWTPITMGYQCVLSTCDQAYLFDPKLSGYREASRKFTFAAEAAQSSFPGLPGRVFISGVPEWTSNVVYYKTAEYLRLKYALDNQVRGSIAIPILEASEKSCCAVLELVTTKEKPNFDAELESVCRSLQAVNLKTSASPRLQYLSSNQRDALAEIKHVLRAVCHAHRLPLALTWIPYNNSIGARDEESIKGYGTNFDGNRVLCIEETSCYVNDNKMEGFVQACLEHYLGKGDGIVGKAFVSNQPSFSSDVKTFDISEYPLVQHARKYGLGAAVAIRLRSTYTGDDDYILELFLPLNMNGSSEQQLLLDNLSGTIQRICRTLRTISDAESIRKQETEDRFQIRKLSKFLQIDASQGSFDGNFNSTGKIFSDTTSDQKNDLCFIVESRDNTNQVMGEPGRLDKKKSTSEKNISLSVLQQYFSGSLKDAAKSLGVCPTTLKRICRQHKIMRWPSRKINKVNRSLKKIQTVLNSVQGIEGGLKFDPTTGEFLATVPFSQELDAQKSSSPFEYSDIYERGEQVVVEEDLLELLQIKSDDDIVKLEEGIDTSHTVPRLYSDANDGNQSWDWAAKESISLDNQSDDCCVDKGREEIKNTNGLFVPTSFKPLPNTDGMDIGNGCSGEGVARPNQSLSSSISDSSNGSDAVVRGSSSTTVEDRSQTKTQKNSRQSGSALTVKATYKDNTIRFKFEPTAGCFHLYNEVGKRFKLSNGMFQLKYLDDEDEWVMLVNDSDLQECLEILDDMGKHSVKFIVRDVHGVIGSSVGSNGYLGTCI